MTNRNRFRVAKLHYAEIKLSHWMTKVMWLLLTNQSALFKRCITLVTGPLICKLVFSLIFFKIIFTFERVYPNPNQFWMSNLAVVNCGHFISFCFHHFAEKNVTKCGHTKKLFFVASLWANETLTKIKNSQKISGLSLTKRFQQSLTTTLCYLLPTYLPTALIKMHKAISLTFCLCKSRAWEGGMASYL